MLYLKGLYFTAERILRQYQVAGQPDVRAAKNDKEYTFELKCKKSSFKTLYEFYYAERDADLLVSFVPNPLGTTVSISTNLDSLMNQDKAYRILTSETLTSKQKRMFARIIRLEELKQSADFLVLRGNNKPWLFIRYG